MRPRPIQRKEYRFVAAYIAIILCMTSLPYLAAEMASGDDWHFNGFLFGVEDGNAYLGKIRLGLEGHWNFYLFYTSEAHDSAPLIYLPYIFAGHVIRLVFNPQTPTSSFVAIVVAFHILRLFFSTFLITATYLFIARFIASASGRVLALILATVGGGLGWLLIILTGSEWLGSPPPEFYIPEGFGFLVLFGLPHIALARGALLLGFVYLFKTLDPPHRNWRWAIAAGLCWLVVGLGVAFYLVIIYCLMLAWGALVWLKQKRFPLVLTLRGTVAVSMTLPLFFYFMALFTFDDTFSQWSAQNILASPHPLQYLLAYLLFIAFSMIGGIWLWKNRPNEAVLLLLGWVLVVPLLVYLPINVQRRMAEGVIIPLAILTVIGLQLVVYQSSQRSFYRRWRQSRAIFMVYFGISTALFLMASTLNGLSTNPPVHRPQEEVAAIDWLSDYANPNAIVLSTLETGNFIPARANLRVFIGHGPETIHSETKRDLVEAFFTGVMTDTEREALLEDYQISFVFYGEEEQLLVENARPQWIGNMRLVYEQGNYRIYEVPQ